MAEKDPSHFFLACADEKMMSISTTMSVSDVNLNVALFKFNSSLVKGLFPL
jgi:hypothetical protein